MAREEEGARRVRGFAEPGRAIRRRAILFPDATGDPCATFPRAHVARVVNMVVWSVRLAARRHWRIHLFNVAGAVEPPGTYDGRYRRY